jgi:8-oxo-dGTP pyrophosphatase MutT (NUDIX family)
LNEPAYACAVIESGGRLLLELRAPDARRAAASLTCFGGGREPGETAEQALLREMSEELAWRPGLPLSPWHASVLAAVAAGGREAVTR